MRSFFPFRQFAAVRRVPRNANRPVGLRLGFETLELRTLLSATPTSGVFLDEIAAPEIDETSRIDVYNIDYRLLESGSVQNPTQNGLKNYSSATYCAVPDAIYVELWEEALARWESVFSEDVEDVVYEGNEIDDLFLYLGFSDSFASTASLGQSIDGVFRRDGGTGLAAVGSLYFNANYFTSNPSDALQTVFFNTALHEVGHALGYNLTTFQANGLVASTQEPALGLDGVFSTATTYYYLGTNGVSRFRETFPDALTALSETTAARLGVSNAVLMETYSTSGSFGTHVSSIYGSFFSFIKQRDGMTYSISPSLDGTISARTLGIMEDLGYSVDYDFADPCATPAPIKLTAEAFGTSVRLSWTPSSGDFSSSVSTATTYSVERLDLSNADAVWSPIANGISETNYVDSTGVSGAAVRYRIVANDVRTYESVGVYRAAPGETFSWKNASNGSKFSVYALKSGSSNGATWAKVGSTSTKNWTSTLTNATLFRIVDESAVAEASEPSRAVDVRLAADADDFVASGYSVADWNALKEFLETSDSQGVKNGEKIDSQYGVGLLDVLAGIGWEKIDGEKRVVSVSWSNLGLVGSLHLTACSELRRVDVSGNALTSFSSESRKLTVLNVSSNELTALDLTKTTALESLNVSTNRLTQIDLSKNDALIYLNVSDIAISELSTANAPALTTLRAERIVASTLDLSANERLTTAFVGSETLSEVVLCQGFAGTVDLTGAAGEPAKPIVWTRDAATLSDKSALKFDGRSAVATIGTGESARRIAFDVAVDPTPETPNDLTFELVAASSLKISWNAANDAVGYKISYRVRSGGPWKALADLKTSNAAPGGDDALNAELLSVSTNILPNRVYTFRILAYSFDASGSVLYSEPFEKAFDPRNNVEKIVSLTLSADAIFVGVPVEVSAFCDGAPIETIGTFFQWFRVDDSEKETQISDGNSATYSPIFADVGFRLKVVATFADSGRTATALSSSRVVLAPPKFFDGEFDALFGDAFDDDWFVERLFSK